LQPLIPDSGGIGIDEELYHQQFVTLSNNDTQKYIHLSIKEKEEKN